METASFNREGANYCFDMFNQIQKNRNNFKRIQLFNGQNSSASMF